MALKLNAVLKSGTLLRKARSYVETQSPSTLSVGCAWWFALEEYGMTEEGVGSNFTMVQSGKHIPQPGVQSENQQCCVILIALALDMMWWEWRFTSKAFLPKIHSPSLTLRKTSDTNRGDVLQNTCQYSSNLQDDQEKESLRNCTDQKSLRRYDTEILVVIILVQVFTSSVRRTSSV